MSHAERQAEIHTIVKAWEVRDELEIRLDEMEKKLALQSDIIHMLVQGYTALLRVQNKDRG